MAGGHRETRACIRERERERDRERRGGRRGGRKRNLEPSRILLVGEFVIHELACGVKLCRKKSESTFFPLSLMTTNTSADGCVRFVDLRKRTRRQSRKAFPPFLFFREEPRGRGWFRLERRHALLRIARVLLNENYHRSGKSRCRNTFISREDTV